MAMHIPDSFNKRSYIEARCNCQICDSLTMKVQMFQLEDVLVCVDCKEELIAA